MKKLIASLCKGWLGKGASWVTSLIGSRWKWIAVGAGILALITGLIVSWTRLQDANTARASVESKRQAIQAAYDKQAKHVSELEAKVKAFKCSQGWSETHAPNGAVEYRCAGSYSEILTVTRYIDTNQTPVFPPQDCPAVREYYRLGVQGGVLAGKGWGWMIGPTWELVPGYTLVLNGGQYNGGWLGKLALDVRVPKRAR